MVNSEQFLPPLITELHSPAGRAFDVGEHDRDGRWRADRWRHPRSCNRPADQLEGAAPEPDHLTNGETMVAFDCSALDRGAVGAPEVAHVHLTQSVDESEVSARDAGVTEQQAMAVSTDLDRVDDGEGQRHPVGLDHQHDRSRHDRIDLIVHHRLVVRRVDAIAAGERGIAQGLQIP